MFADLFLTLDIHPVDDYQAGLGNCSARYCAAAGGPTTPVVLTPEIVNSAYFEHAYLAQQVGARPGRGARPGGRCR